MECTVAFGLLFFLDQAVVLVLLGFSHYKNHPCTSHGTIMGIQQVGEYASCAYTFYHWGNMHIMCLITNCTHYEMYLSKIPLIICSAQAPTLTGGRKSQFKEIVK
jgi:hypothetical protein